jgi:hypothetical protein
MELVDGVVLCDRLRTTVDLADSTRIGVALVDAVAQYHEHQIAHMDLHEGNVIIGIESVKVLDPLYLDTALFASTATREALQRRDLQALRDLLCQVLEVTDGVAMSAVDEFRRYAGRAGTGEIRKAFETVLASAARVPPSATPAPLPGAPAVSDDQFDEALARGQAAHERAVRAKAEIYDILARLSRAVMTRTDGKVCIRLGVKRTMQAGLAISAFMTHYVAGEISEDVVYDTVYASRLNGRAVDRMPLCNIELDVHGYPVTLSRRDVVRHANSKDELIAALRGFIADPDVAGNIRRVQEIDVVVQKAMRPADSTRVLDVASRPAALPSGGDASTNDVTNINEGERDA